MNIAVHFAKCEMHINLQESSPSTKFGARLILLFGRFFFYAKYSDIICRYTYVYRTVYSLYKYIFLFTENENEVLIKHYIDHN